MLLMAFVLRKSLFVLVAISGLSCRVGTLGL